MAVITKQKIERTTVNNVRQVIKSLFDWNLGRKANKFIAIIDADNKYIAAFDAIRFLRILFDASKRAPLVAQILSDNSCKNIISILIIKKERTYQ